MPLPTPPPTPPLATTTTNATTTAPMMPGNASSTISGRINIATRKQHTELNRLLIQRLPLALPPHQSTPLLFGKGIVPFAHIINVFETEWELLIRHARKLDDANVSHGAEVRRWLANLRPSGLARSNRLQNDLRHLRLVAGPSIFNTRAPGDAWVKEMRALMRQKPHVLVAFAWVFYMATFSGGRWIRQQLANGGAEFWTERGTSATSDKDKQAALPLQLPGFTFLSFDGHEDGEDIKALFKHHLSDGETLLTASETKDIVDASTQIFDRCLSLVAELDRMVMRDRIVHRVPSIFGVLLLLFILFFLRHLGYFVDLRLW